AGLSTQLEAFAANTMEYMKRERALLLDGVGVPDVATQLDGRHALVVVRGYDYKEDLHALRPYIRDYRPVLIGVDGGADALREAGYQPDMIIGDMDSTFLTRLRLGGKLVDAKGVSRLYRSRISTTALVLLVIAALVSIGSALAVSTAGRVYLDLLIDQWDSFVFWLENLFT